MRRTAKEEDGSYSFVFSKKDIKELVRKKVKVPKGDYIYNIEGEIYVDIAPIKKR